MILARMHDLMHATQAPAELLIAGFNHCMQVSRFLSNMRIIVIIQISSYKYSVTRSDQATKRHGIKQVYRV